MWRAILAILAAAAASTLLVRAAPGYDPWTWLLWGREVAGGTLSTADGPAFKPLPVAVCALLAPLGSAAPVVWVVLVRAAGAALCCATGSPTQRGSGRDARRLAGLAAGVLAVAGVALAGGFALEAARGQRGAAGDRGRARRRSTAGAPGGCARRWRSARRARCCGSRRGRSWRSRAWWRGGATRARGRWVAGLALLVPAAWFVPEWLGSGDVLRSGSRARVPNPGQPALADVPALASLWAAAKLLLIPLWIGVVLALRDPRARLLAAAGGAWVLLVAVMAQAGFSGEPRYALPGVALLAVAGAAGLARAVPCDTAPLARWGSLRSRWRRCPRWSTLPRVRDAQAHQWALARDLDGAVRAAGGREAVLACGRPYVGRLRGPLMAYALDVTKRTVEPDAAPRAPGVVFRARLTAGARPAPDAGPPFRPAARVGEWQVLRSCSRN